MRVRALRSADVLAVEDMLGDVAVWQPSAWADWLATRRRWNDELLDWLMAKHDRLTGALSDP